jgi:isopentenyl-diphosphate delta-isomerase
MSTEQVVLLDEDGNAIGTAAKAEVHGTHTPLHLAFSCYVFDSSGRLLVTRRALDKPTFPGVWTNSVCGHPGPGEEIFAAVRRRAMQELGLTLDGLELVLPRFRYDATMPGGVRENELCPVFTAHSSSDVHPDPAEVAEAEWMPWTTFRDDVRAGVRQVSVWCAKQVPELAARERGDGRFESAPYGELPPAARTAG